MYALMLITMCLLPAVVCLPEREAAKGSTYRDPAGLWLTSGCAADCEELQDIHVTKIPNNDNILSKDTFESFIVGRTYNKFYHAMTQRSWSSVVHFFTRFQKVNETSAYRWSSFADDIFSNECHRSEYMLTPLDPGTNNALFIDSNNRAYAIFSSCPDKYYISYFCDNYISGQAVCAIENTMISIYLPNSAHDIPLYKIVEDVFNVTGVRFGASNFMWKFTYGQNAKQLPKTDSYRMFPGQNQLVPSQPNYHTGTVTDAQEND